MMLYCYEDLWDDYKHISIYTKPKSRMNNTAAVFVRTVLLQLPTSGWQMLAEKTAVHSEGAQTIDPVRQPCGYVQIRDIQRKKTVISSTFALIIFRGPWQVNSRDVWYLVVEK